MFNIFGCKKKEENSQVLQDNQVNQPQEQPNQSEQGNEIKNPEIQKELDQPAQQNNLIQRSEPLEKQVNLDEQCKKIKAPQIQKEKQQGQKPDIQDNPFQINQPLKKQSNFQEQVKVKRDLQNQDKDTKNILKSYDGRISLLEVAKQNDQKLIQKLINDIEQLQQLGGGKNEIQQLESQIMSQIQIDRSQVRQKEKQLEENIKQVILGQLTQEINKCQNQFKEGLSMLQQQILNRIDQNQQGTQLDITLKNQNEILTQIMNKLTILSNQVDQQKNTKELSIQQKLQEFNEQLNQLKDNYKNDISEGLRQQQTTFQQSIQELSKYQDLIKSVEQAFQQEISQLNQIQINNHENLQQQINQNKQEFIEIIQKNSQNEDLSIKLDQNIEQIYEQIAQQKLDLIELCQNPGIEQKQFNEQIFQQVEKLKNEIQEYKGNQNIAYAHSSFIVVNKTPSPPPEIIQIPEQTIITTLYDKTFRLRQVDIHLRKFVREIVDQSGIFKEFSIRSSDQKAKIRAKLSGMRTVRGDGNCFYTAFVFQYLQYQISQASDLEFQKMIDEIQSLPFEIHLKDCQFDQYDFQVLKQKFTIQCQQLRQQENKEDQLLQYFSDQEHEFYGLANVFLRNLAFKVCDNEETKAIMTQDLRQELLEYEEDCNSNEIVIKNLCDYLKLHVIFYWIDRDKNLTIMEYTQVENPSQVIHLLFTPGHYAIGIPVN